MALLNYTTTISVSKTLGEIQAILARHGARSILVEYDDARQPCGLAFAIPTRFGERSFRLPANIAGVHRTLAEQWEAGRIAPRFATPEQAARTGWRILKDWVEAQTAIIEAGMVEASEVYLPYLIAPDGRTAYQVITERQLLLPEGRP